MLSARKKEKIKVILRKELQAIKPSSSELSSISVLVKNFSALLGPELKNADLIVGGSFSKGTMIRKGSYDIDLFIRFGRAYRKKSAELADILAAALKRAFSRLKTKQQAIKIERLRGSRDYFSISLAKEVPLPAPITFEIVPVLKIRNAKEALNVTDVSPLHITYILKKVKLKPKLADEIRLLKAFCYAQDYYGAESYIRGFSGYSLELLTCYYGSFLNLIKAACRWKPKVIIDPAKFYKGKEALAKLNEAKLKSPIVLIDPTQADRNTTAALSMKCFKRFVKACGDFLANPSEKFFKRHDVDRKKLLAEAKRRKAKLLMLEVKSTKHKEDVAGAKLLKFFNFLLRELKKDFLVLKAEWTFKSAPIQKEKEALFFFIISRKKRILVRGPPLKLSKYAALFKKKWPRCIVKNRTLYAVRKCRLIEEILKIKNLKERGIKSVKIKNL